MGSMMNGANPGYGVWVFMALMAMGGLGAAFTWAARCAGGSRRRALPNPAVQPASAALDELDLRYARGELDVEQYRAQRAELSRGLHADRGAGL